MSETEPEEFNPDAFLFGAVYRADDQLIRRAKMQFIRQFSREEYNTWLAPYLRREPGYVFGAPRTKYLYWFIDRLARLLAEEFNIEYIPHSQLLAPDIPDHIETQHCVRCNHLVEPRSAKNGLCCICVRDEEATTLQPVIEDSEYP